jgi:hypothetical protein
MYMFPAGNDICDLHWENLTLVSCLLAGWCFDSLIVDVVVAA